MLMKFFLIDNVGIVGRKFEKLLIKTQNFSITKFFYKSTKLLRKMAIFAFSELSFFLMINRSLLWMGFKLSTTKGRSSFAQVPRSPDRLFEPQIGGRV